MAGPLVDLTPFATGQQALLSALLAALQCDLNAETGRQILVSNIDTFREVSRRLRDLAGTMRAMADEYDVGMDHLNAFLEASETDAKADRVALAMDALDRAANLYSGLYSSG